jgi:hypothetical protein
MVQDSEVASQRFYDRVLLQRADAYWYDFLLLRLAAAAAAAAVAAAAAAAAAAEAALY